MSCVLFCAAGPAPALAAAPERAVHRSDVTASVVLPTAETPLYSGDGRKNR